MNTSTLTTRSLLTGLVSGVLGVANAFPTNPSMEITHRVVVNPIIAKSSSGATAQGMGTPAQRADIIDRVNHIWAQAGIEVVFEDTQFYVNDFTYGGDGSGGYRSEYDLYTILELEDSPAQDSATDIDLFFVEALPGFNPLGSTSIAGLADIDGGGITVFVGSILPRFEPGREFIANVIAHEIGHNLGLDHIGGANLMTSSPTTDQLDQQQIATVFTDTVGADDGFDLIMPATAPPTFYDLFVENFDLSGGPLDDDDGDSLVNIIEFAIGTDPTVEGDALPVPEADNRGGLQWIIPKTEGAVKDGIVYKPEVARVPGDFKVAGAPGSGARILVDNDTEIRVQIASLEVAFMHLRLEGIGPEGPGAPQLTQELAEELERTDIAPVQLSAEKNRKHAHVQKAGYEHLHEH